MSDTNEMMTASQESPGQYPFTRGIVEQPVPWVMGQYAGFGSPEDSNRRFKELLKQGVTGFSVALDLPTQLGLDTDAPEAEGEVGRVGVAIDSLADIEILMDGIPLEEIKQVRTTANSIGYLWAAFFFALAEKRGVNPSEFGLLIQNDVLKEFIARGTQIFPPEPSVRLTVDTIAYCAEHAPTWTPLAMSGYHIREAGSDAAQEIAFTFANAKEYLDGCIARGIPVDSFVPSLFVFFSVGMNFVGEIAKFRAARRVWATLLRDVYGSEDPESQKLRIFSFTAGSSLTAQQPENNIARACIEAMAAVVGGIQTLHVSAFDEALGVPTERAALLGLRTQQIIANETHLLDTADPFGGAPHLEKLTDELERQAWDWMDQIAERGGAIRCIEEGWFQRHLSDGAYQALLDVESGARKVVGVNMHADYAEESFEVFQISDDAEAGQRERLSEVRSQRDDQVVRESLAHLREAARSERNIMPEAIAAVKAYATVGEIVGVLREECGEYSPSSEV